MKLLKKVISAFVAAILLGSAIGMFTGCSSKLKPEDDRTVLTINGDKVSYDEFRYIYMNNKADMDGGDASVWTGEDSAALTETLNTRVMNALKRNAAIRAMAKEYKISLSSDEISAVNDQIQAMRDTYGSEEAFQKSMNEAYMTEYSLYEMQCLMTLWNDVYSYVTNEMNAVFRADDEVLLADIPKNFWRATQILIKNDDKDNAEDNRKLADEIRAKLDAGEDFDKLLAEYGEDPSLKGNSDGYYFTSGELLGYFEDAVKEMEIGEISEVIPCVYGYSIIRRLPMEDAYISKHLEDLRKAFMARTFNEMLDQTAEKLECKTTALYDQIAKDGIQA